MERIESWKTITQTAVVTGSLISMVVALIVTLMGQVFTPRVEFTLEQQRLTDTRRDVRFVACSIALNVDTCMVAHGITIEELLSDYE